MKIIGVDPGVTGGIALLDTEHRERLRWVIPMPVADSRVIGRDVANLLHRHQPYIVAIEDTQPMSKNGSVPSFKLGLNTGIVIGVVQGLGFSMVRLRPAEWKKQMRLTGKDKDASRGLATELWPTMADNWKLKNQDGLAEAALIAEAQRRLEFKQ